MDGDVSLCKCMVATFVVRQKPAVLKNNPRLAKWNTDRLFGEYGNQWPEKAKSYLLEVIWLGEETGKKATASDVAFRMKSARDETGQTGSARSTG